MRALVLVCILQCFAFCSTVFTENGIVYSGRVWDSEQDECIAVPAGRVPWIKYVRNSDYGWGEHTHRANLALAVNGYPGEPEEKRKMQLQLEVEATKALFWKKISQIHDNDLALFIHALLAVQKNPRDFHGTDLAGELLQRVELKISNGRTVHPFLVLALCNSHLVDQHHLESIVRFTSHDENVEHEIDGRQAELKALALKSFACAADLNRNLYKFRTEMKNAAKCLVRRQNRVMDGSFGNVYTTSLAVQALIAAAPFLDRNDWDEKAAVNFLLKEAYIKANMIKAYYIEMALNAKDVTFIRQLYPGVPLPGEEVPRDSLHFIDYTIKNDLYPDFFFSLKIKVNPRANFFETMKRASSLSDGFSFEYTNNNEGLPMVHMVSGIPNDAEENMFWRICRQREVDHNRHVSRWTNFHDSPLNLMPFKEEHIILWYRNTECPQS